MVWSSRKTFKEVYELAKSYYLKNGNLRVPYNFKTEDGTSYNDKVNLLEGKSKELVNKIIE